MQLEAKKYLSDIQVAADRVQRFTKDKEFADYLADEMLRAAVERQFSIIGEALARLARDFPGPQDRVGCHRNAFGITPRGGHRLDQPAVAI